MTFTPILDAPHLAAAFVAAFLAGGINSVAGGGTLVSFPALVGLGLPSVIANATNTLAIWPGSIGSMWGFRKELARVDKRMRMLIIPGAIGGATGATLLHLTPPGVFDRIVPFLILFATVLFSVQSIVQNKLKTNKAETRQSTSWMIGACLMQLGVGIYGGYFGAGISIIMLSLLGILGMTDILEMSALTSLLSLCINGVAALFFIYNGLICWPYVIVMAGGALIGGYGAAGVARKIGRLWVRRFVLTVGYTMAIVMFVRMLH